MIYAAVISYTESGRRKAEEIADALLDNPDIYANVQSCVFGRDFKDTRQLLSGEIKTENSGLFDNMDVIIFVSAVGIAVRMTAPLIKSKLTDPAVLVVDDRGRFVIPILSGHIGGANEISELLARKLGALPVITTASDIRPSATDSHTIPESEASCEAALQPHPLTAVDLWAKENGFCIDSMQKAKHLTAAMLSGVKPDVNFADGILTASFHYDGKMEAVVLSPRRFVVGIGCRRGTDADRMSAVVHGVLAENDIKKDDIFRVCSIDIKADEQAVKRLADEFDVPFVVYTAEELNSVAGEFSDSEFVKNITGTGNVCGRSAAAGCLSSEKTEKIIFGNISSHEEQVLKKQTAGGITVAISRRIVTWKNY